MKRVMLIDGNSLLYAAQDAPKLTSGDQEVQAIYGFLKKLRSVVTEYEAYQPIVLWDGKAKWRFDIWPEYKGNRSVTPEQKEMKASVKAQRPFVIKFLHTMGVLQLSSALDEADDIAAFLVKEAHYDTALLITGDKDWQQLVNDKTRWYDPRSARLVTCDNFTEMTGFKNTRQFVEAKALAGDGSDNIPGVGGIAEVGALQIFDRADGVDQFLVGNWGKLPKKLQDFIDNATPKESSKWGVMSPMQDAFKRNMQLMDLSKSAVLKGNLNRVRSAPNQEKFTDMCMSLNFISLLRDPQWFTPFKRNYERSGVDHG